MDMDISKSKFEGAMLGIGIGDALGMPLEGMTMDEIKVKYGKVTEFIDGRLPKGSFTDDTEMTLAVAEAILDKGIDINYIAYKLADKHTFDRGYGPGTLFMLRSILRGKNWMKLSSELFGSGSYGNGCIVRTTPLILLLHKYKDILIKYVNDVCKITHSHKYAIEATRLFTEVLLLALNGHTDKNDYLDVVLNACESKIYYEKIKLIKKYIKGDYSEHEIIKSLGNGVESYNTIPISIYSFLKNIESFRDALIYTVNLGGDADTIGAIVGAWSGALHGSNSIPENWRYNLEKFDYIIELANELYIIHNYIEIMYGQVQERIRKQFGPN